VDFIYPSWHWHRWFCFTAKVQMLNDNCNHNGHNAYANEKQEIHNCNMQYKHKHINVCRVLTSCIVYILFFYVLEEITYLLS